MLKDFPQAIKQEISVTEHIHKFHNRTKSCFIRVYLVRVTVLLGYINEALSSTHFMEILLYEVY